MAGSGFAQKSGSEFKRHSVGINTSLSSFFDGNGISGILTITEKAQLRFMVGLGGGMDYGFQFRNNHKVRLSTGFFVANYRKANKASLSQGTVLNRWMVYGCAVYMYPLKSTENWLLYGLGGTNFRYGEEFFLVSSGGWDSHGNNNILRDAGIIGGVNATYLLSKHFSLYIETTFTRWLYRFDKGDRAYPDLSIKQKSAYSFDRGATKNMVSINLGTVVKF